MRLLTLCGLNSVCSGIALAGTPLWSFVVDSAYPPQISVSANGTEIVKYIVHNNTRKSHQLVMAPITGISQAGPCNLGPKGSSSSSCVLVLNINGNALPVNPIQNGPSLCQTNSDGSPGLNQCYQPALRDRLNISRSSVTNQSYIFAAGGYIDTNGIQRPLIVVGSGSGGQWVYPASVNEVVFTPDNSTHPFGSNGDFNGMACSGATCIATGTYTDTTPRSLAMLALTTNYGGSWTYPSAIPNVAVIDSHTVASGQLMAASCTSSICLSVGNFSDPANVTYPMVVSSTDNGASWSYSDSAAQVVFVPDNASHPRLAIAAAPSGFNGASCSGSICIGTGFYLDTTSTQRPLLAQSLNNGAWVYPSSVNAVIFSPDNASHPFANSGAIGTAFCNQSLCLSGGSYRDNLGTYRPLLVQSLDLGTTWIYPSSINAAQFTPDNATHPYQNHGFLDGSSCSGLLCALAGSYQDNTNVYRPLLALSVDGGVSWTYPSSINEVQFAPDNVTHLFDQNGWLGPVSCTGTTCVAVGSYIDPLSISRPLLVRSSDGGATWIYPSEINEVIFTPDNLTSPFANDGEFNWVNCAGDVCVAAGSYTDTNTISRPLLAYSTDRGISWIYPSDVTAVNFSPMGAPNPFSNNGYFRVSAASSISGFLPESLRFLS